MDQVTLGRTGITVCKNGFGALPIQRVSVEEGVRILQAAYEGGITFFDTARAYTDSEKKIGLAFAGMREKVYLSTKTMAVTPEDFWRDLDASLCALQTDYIDIYQFHNPSFCPKPGDGSGLYECMEEAKRQGKIRHIAITNHRLSVASEAVDSGLYETLQFPFCYLATKEDLALVKKTHSAGMGFLAMKSLSGGLIRSAKAAYAFASQFDGVLPIWGIQRMEELKQFLSFQDNPPRMDEELQALIEQDRAELMGNFCRGCGYCMPCPVGIEINNAARMSQLIRRSPSEQWLSPLWQEKMSRIDNCLHCGQCMRKCPYGLNTPELLARNWQDYKEIVAGKPL